MCTLHKKIKTHILIIKDNNNLEILEELGSNWATVCSDTVEKINRRVINYSF